MGFMSTLSSLIGFGGGLCGGVFVGYYAFFFFKPNDVKEPTVRPLVELDSESIDQLLPEIPLWVKNPDFERTDWLNKLIEHMWPYLDKAICKSVDENVKQVIVESCAKYNIHSVAFTTLNLGLIPPTFHGMKAYETHDKELIMEPLLKWAGNPNIILVVKSLGMKATIQVVDLQVFLVPRVTLKPLVPSFPCFANIFVSLMEKPHIDFGLKVCGADIMSIPGLYIYIQETIKNQIAAMCMWPRSLEFPIIDASMAEKKPVGILHVKVVKASNLKNVEVVNKSDPYVKLKLTEDRLPSMKTTIKRNNLNPEWNEEFKFVVKDPDYQALELHVYDWEKVGKPGKLGMTVIPLKDLTPEEIKSMEVDLLENMDPNDDEKEKSCGKIYLEMMYRPFKENLETMLENKIIQDGGLVETAPDGTPSSGGLLVCIVHEAGELEGKYHTNPYVRVHFKGEKRKTKHIRKNRSPRWDEDFHFMCEEPPLDEKIHVEVISKPSSIGIHGKEILGFVEIRLADVIHNKRTNEKYNLIDSRNGYIQIELQWRTS